MSIKPEDTYEVVDVADHTHFDQFAAQASQGIRFVAEPYGPEAEAVLKADTGDFVKWLKSEQPMLAVGVERAKSLVLNADDVWLSLAFLANNVALPVYLNMVSSYLYARFKQALKGEKPRVHLSAEYTDPNGCVKRFNFEGDQEALEKAIKKFDLNTFMGE